MLELSHFVLKKISFFLFEFLYNKFYVNPEIEFVRDLITDS